MAKLSKERLDAIKYEYEDRPHVPAKLLRELLDHIAALEQEQGRKWTWYRTDDGWFIGFRNKEDYTEVFDGKGWFKGGNTMRFATIAALTAAVEAAERGPVYGAAQIADMWIPTKNGRKLYSYNGWGYSGGGYGAYVKLNGKEDAIAFARHYDELREKAVKAGWNTTGAM